MLFESATALRFGDIILISFPFTNQTASKQRPAVIVGSAAYNSARPDIVIMAITSQLGSKLSPDDVPIEAWQQAGLLKPSAVKPVFATVEQSLILRRLGTIEPSDELALRTAIAAILQ